MKPTWKSVAAAVIAIAAIHTGGASAQTGKQMTFAVQISPDVPQVIIAQERGFWKEAGVDVRLIPFSSGREAFEALLGGQIDFAALADFPATIGIVRNQKFTIIGDLSRYKAQRVIASSARLPLASLSELQGKKVGTTLGSNAEYITSIILNEGGVKAGQIVNVAPPDMVPALVRGDIDAAVMFPSLYAQARKALGKDYREIITKRYQSHFLLATRPDMLASRAGEVNAFMRALVRADAVIRSEPAAAQESVVRAMKGLMSADVLAEMWKDLEYRIVLNEDLVSLIQREAAWIIERGMVKAPPSVSERQNIRSFINAGPLTAAAKENVTLQP